MAWILDTTMKAIFLPRLKTKIRTTCVNAIIHNDSVKQSLARDVLASDLRPYTERLQACLVGIWMYESDDSIQRHAAEACDIMRGAVNICSFTDSDELLADLKGLRIKVHTAFILASCLTHSPLEHGKALTKKWTTYFTPHLLEDDDFRSTLAQANSKQFKGAIELSKNYTSRRRRPKREKKNATTVVGPRIDKENTRDTRERNISNIPIVVQAVVDAVLVETTDDRDAGITCTDTGVRVDRINPSSHTEMTLYGTCQTCDMEAFGELDTEMAFHCQQCWQCWERDSVLR